MEKVNVDSVRRWLILFVREADIKTVVRLFAFAKRLDGRK